MRRIFCSVAAAALIAVSLPLAACGDDDDDAGTTPTTSGGVPGNLTKVTISDNKFTPSNLQVPVGANVTWEWTGSNPHSVTGKFDGQDVNSPRLSGTGVFLFAFPKAGTFEYQCGVHGSAMTGKVTIQ